MGLSLKQVSSDSNSWKQALLDDARTLEFPKTSPIMRRQQSQSQQQETLNCPRCDSTNTKFCYYNNYNKSQPRHFCKSCKRHWTKGGTLRNVPVGGGRKNKRLKTSKTVSKTTINTTTTTTSTTTTNTNNNVATTFNSGISNNSSNTHLTLLQPSQLRFSPPLLEALSGDNVLEDKIFSKAFYQNFLDQKPCSSLQETSITFTSKGLNDQEIQIPYSNLTNFEGNMNSNNDNNNSCSISLNITSIQSPNLHNVTTCDHANSHHHDEQPPWTLHETSKKNNNDVMDMSNNWGWDLDFEKFVSIENDLIIPWDDKDIIP